MFKSNRVQFVLFNNMLRNAKNKQMFVEGKKMLANNKIQNTKYNNHNNYNNYNNYNKIITRKFTTSSYSSNSKPPNFNPKWLYIALVCGGFLSFTKNIKKDK